MSIAGALVRRFRPQYRKLCPSLVHRMLVPIAFRLKSRLLSGKWSIEVIDGLRFHLDLGELIDNQLYWNGAFEPVTKRRLQELCGPGMIVLDIGSNIGAHTLFIAQAVGTEGCIHAIEPSSYAFNKLLTNLDLNNLSQVIPHRIGFSDVEMRAVKTRVYSSWPTDHRRSETGLNPALPNARSMEDIIDLMPLDTFAEREALERIDLIKIDIDGHEPRLLTGGSKTFQRFRPILVFELCERALRHYGGSAREYIATLKSWDYQIIFETSLEQLSEDDLSLIEKKQIDSVNLLAFQPSKVHEKARSALKAVAPL